MATAMDMNSCHMEWLVLRIVALGHIVAVALAHIVAVARNEAAVVVRIVDVECIVVERLGLAHTEDVMVAKRKHYVERSQVALEAKCRNGWPLHHFESCRVRVDHSNGSGVHDLHGAVGGQHFGHASVNDHRRGVDFVARDVGPVVPDSYVHSDALCSACQVSSSHVRHVHHPPDHIAGIVPSQK